MWDSWLLKVKELLDIYSAILVATEPTKVEEILNTFQLKLQEVISKIPLKKEEIYEYNWVFPYIWKIKQKMGIHNTSNTQLIYLMNTFSEAVQIVLGSNIHKKAIALAELDEKQPKVLLNWPLKKPSIANINMPSLIHWESNSLSVQDIDTYKKALKKFYNTIIRCKEYETLSEEMKRNLPTIWKTLTLRQRILS